MVALLINDGQEDWMLPDEAFQAAGCRVVRAGRLTDAAARCGDVAADLVFLPLTLEGRSTTTLMRQCLAMQPTPVVVIVATNEQINSAAEAMRIGAYDCLFKPFSHTRLARTIEGAIKQVRQVRLADRGGARRGEPAPPLATAPHRPDATAAALDPGRSPAAPAGRPGPRLSRRGFVAASAQMRAVLDQLTAVAASDAPVFLTGEVGTGKSAMARIVHELSPRAGAAFVTQDCVALAADTLFSEFAGPRGALHRAGGGTLFLDEIGDLAPEVQPMLLRLIERARADGPEGGSVRFVASTAHDPRALLREGRVRPDLFYRLHVAPIAVPPLRARDGDLALLARTRLEEFSEAEGRGFVGFSEAAMDRMLAYDWPGNLRELINLVWTVVLMNEGPLVTPDMLPADIRNAPRGDDGALPAPDGSPRHLAPPNFAASRTDAVDRMVGRTLAEIEKMVIEATIQAEDGSVPRAARVLDVSPSTLYRKREAWAKRG